MSDSLRRRVQVEVNWAASLGKQYAILRAQVSDPLCPPRSLKSPAALGTGSSAHRRLLETRKGPRPVLRSTRGDHARVESRTVVLIGVPHPSHAGRPVKPVARGSSLSCRPPALNRVLCNCSGPGAAVPSARRRGRICSKLLLDLPSPVAPFMTYPCRATGEAANRALHW